MDDDGLQEQLLQRYLSLDATARFTAMRAAGYRIRLTPARFSSDDDLVSHALVVWVERDGRDVTMVSTMRYGLWNVDSCLREAVTLIASAPDTRPCCDRDVLTR